MSNMPSTMKLNGIQIQDIDYFGSRVGFCKIKADIRWADDDRSIPGIVFLRGDAVAVLVRIKVQDKVYVVFVQQPRIPIANFNNLELPAGMLDGSNHFTGVAAQELKEECGLDIAADDLIPLKRVCPSGGGCDEMIGLYAVNKSMSRDELERLQNRIGGLHEHGERIKVVLVPWEEALTCSNDSKAICAIALYSHLRRE